VVRLPGVCVCEGGSASAAVQVAVRLATATCGYRLRSLHARPYAGYRLRSLWRRLHPHWWWCDFLGCAWATGQSASGVVQVYEQPRARARGQASVRYLAGGVQRPRSLWRAQPGGASAKPTPSSDQDPCGTAFAVVSMPAAPLHVPMMLATGWGTHWGHGLGGDDIDNHLPTIVFDFGPAAAALHRPPLGAWCGGCTFAVARVRVCLSS
jgi:hypothetical protein